MVATSVSSPPEKIDSQPVVQFPESLPTEPLSLEAWLAEPVDGTEWIDGQIIAKNNMGSKHSRIQAKLARYWGNYQESSGQGGEVYTEATCQTQKQGRRPDVAYLTPELVSQFGEFTTLPQSFIFIAEIISPSDRAEEVFTKVKEYLNSGCEEVWLIFPDSQWLISITNEQQIFYREGTKAKTQKVLPGFAIAVEELF